MEICSIFESIDGEVNAFGQGAFTVFVRLSKCNLRCDFCDTTFSFENGKQLSIDDIFSKIRSYGVHNVTITGGEPLLQKEEVTELIDILISNRYTVSIETNGTFPPIYNFNDRDDVCWVFDYKLGSSKMDDRMNIENFIHLRPFDYVKFVINDESDFRQAVRVQTKLIKAGCKAKFAYSPVHNVLDAAHLVNWLSVSKHKNGAIVNLQLHKLIWPSCGKNEER